VYKYRQSQQSVYKAQRRHCSDDNGRRCE